MNAPLDEQDALLHAAFGVPEPDATRVGAAADAVERALAHTHDERSDVLAAAFATPGPDAADTALATAQVMARLEAAPARPVASRRTWRSALLVAALLLVAVLALRLLGEPTTPRATRTGAAAAARTEVDVRLVEGPIGLIGVQRVSQRAAERLVLEVGGSGTRAARTGTGRQVGSERE